MTTPLENASRGNTDTVSWVLKLDDVWKAFGGVAALSGAELSLQAGEIHALVGENGAGKSTLINIATGVQQPDRGTVSVNGVMVHLPNPRGAVDHGISVVHQERNLVAKFSVAENLFLGNLPLVAGLVNRRRMVAEARPWLERVGLDIDPLTEAGRLSPGQAQLLEIGKALAQRCEVLLLDEPTSSIAEGDLVHLFAILKSLSAEGTSVLFVSHKLEEVYALCDRVTVLRDGRNVLTGRLLAELSRSEIVHAMVGRSVDTMERSQRRAREHEETRLELVGVSTEFGHRDVNLIVRVGEIVGLYGLVGAGRTELARCLVGLGKITGGEMLIDSKPVRVRNPYDALRNHRIGYVSEDRKGEGTILAHSISRNVGITVWDRVKRHLGWISERLTRSSVQEPVRRLKVKMNSLIEPVSSLSGGNQQKVSVAKWIAADAELLIFDEPTCGIDVATKDEMHRLLRELADQDKAILLISSDLREVIQLADRLLVMGGFRLLAEIENTGEYDVMSKQVMHAITEASILRPVG
jgi:ribose transport system ATP-binding protein